MVGITKRNKRNKKQRNYTIRKKYYKGGNAQAEANVSSSTNASSSTNVSSSTNASSSTNDLFEGSEPVGGKKGIHKRKSTKTFQPSHCHPGSKKFKKNIHNSCYSPEELKTILHAYNQHHTSQPEKQIHTSDHGTSLRKLQEKVPQCTTEICWLRLIPDRALREKVRHKIFRPLQPSEWRKKPNAWLSNFDIDTVIQQYEETYPDFVFLGPTPIDFDKVKADGKCVTEEICGLSLAKQWAAGKKKIGVIYNLDTSDGPGTHWVSMFIDMSDEVPYLFYFNSTAEQMPSQVRDLIDRIQTQWLEMNDSGKKHTGTSFAKPLVEYTSDDKVEHQHSNTECGMYSLFFIITCLTRKIGGYASLGKDLTREKIVRLFAGNKRIPDGYIARFRKLYFLQV